MTNGYIPSLDGIRAVSVFLVLLSHCGLGHILPGGLGVTVFFFLSGFLITTLLIQEYKKSNRINYSLFFYRRFFRLFPPLFITLLFAYSLSAIGLLGGETSINGALYQIFYLANYASIFSWEGDTPDGLVILWSLAVEEHFYLVFPALLYLLLRNTSQKVVILFLTGICLLTLGWRFYLVMLEQATEYRIYYATDTRIDSILFGCIMALIWNLKPREKTTQLDKKALLLILGSVSLLLFTLLYRDESFRQTLRYSLQGIALAPLFYYSITCSDHTIFKWLNWQWMRKLGIYSYFIYLIHFVVVHFLKHNNIANSTIEVIIYTTVLSILFAYLVDKYIDTYFQKIRKKLH